MLATDRNERVPSGWVVDSGATHHFCHNVDFFSSGSLRPCSSISIRLGDHSRAYSKAYGTIQLNSSIHVTALFVPKFRVSLFSVPLFDIKGWSTIMANRTCIVKSLSSSSVSSNPHIITAPLLDNLYRWTPAKPAAHITTRSGGGRDILSVSRHPRPSSPKPQAIENLPVFPAHSDPPSAPRPRKESLPKARQENKKSDSIELWHRRLAHLNPGAMRKLLDSTIHFSSSHDLSSCDVCISAKH